VILRVIVILFIGGIVFPVHASFDKLVKSVSSRFDTPDWVIRKVCTHESQSYFKGKRQPWPWTLNVAGKSYWFKDKGSAISFAELELMSGKTNFDVGICQINWRWHGHNFSSVRELFNPIKNIEYAIKYLKKIKGDRSWKYAIGAYHSPNNQERAAQYVSSVLRL